MPIYEYLCPSCDSKFEQLRPIGCAEEDGTCPECSTQARRVVSIFSAFSKSNDSGTASIAGAGGGCSGCAATSCSTCN